MSEYVCFLITLLYIDELVSCAIKIHRSKISQDVIDFPMEPGHRKILHDMLPLHVKSCGPIVLIEEIFEVHTVQGN